MVCKVIKLDLNFIIWVENLSDFSIAAKYQESKSKNEVKCLLDELVNVKLIKQDLVPPYKVQFEGDFVIESFASHGIILIGEKIFKVCFS